MIIVMRPGASEEQKNHVRDRIRDAGLEPHAIVGTERVVFGAVGDERDLDIDYFQTCPGVETVHRILAPYKMASREWRSERSVVEVAGARFGADRIAVVAGPCTVEDRSMVLETAHAVKEAGAVMLRGGAFKPRTSPYDFQGLMEEGLEILAEAREQTGLPVVTEVMSPNDVLLVQRYADVLQVGARNMQNFLLLKALGQSDRPVLLKRGMAAQLDEFLLAAEYVLKQGNPGVLLCERGIRTFESHTRNTLSLSVVPAIREQSHLPVLVDPSHGTGRASLVTPMSLAAVACGADGLMVEVHPDPERAMVDGAQSLTLEGFGELMKKLVPVAEAVGRAGPS